MKQAPCKMLVLIWAVIAYSTILSQVVEGKRKDAAVDDKVDDVPTYTTYISQIHDAAVELNKNIKSKNPEDRHVHYLMIANALDQLIDNVAKDGSVPNYRNIVDKAIAETLHNPQAVAVKVKEQIYKTISKIGALKDFINEKQTNGECAAPISRQCDLLIKTAIKTSKDGLLKKQADYLTTLAKQINLYLKEYSQEFGDVARNTNAPKYLIKGKNRLDSFIKAAAETRRSGKKIKVDSVDHE